MEETSLYKSFNRLDESRRQNILNECIIEFAEKGYTNASTNTIAKNAGIAKGLLFYYFENKKNLFLYILEHIGSLITCEIVSSIQKIESDDFFNKIKELSLIRIKTYSKYSNEYKLLVRAISASPQELKSEIEKIYLDYYKTLNGKIKEHVYNYLDGNILNTDVSLEKATEFISLVFDQLTQKYLKLYVGRDEELIRNPKPLFDEIDNYIDIIKFGIYSH